LLLLSNTVVLLAFLLRKARLVFLDVISKSFENRIAILRKLLDAKQISKDLDELEK